MLLPTLLLALAAMTRADDELVDWRSLTLDDGRELTYALVVPEGPGPHPLLLALPPGDQGEAMVTRGLELYWTTEARARGWLVVSPARPGAGPFHAGDLDALVQLVDAVRAEHDIEEDALHLAGVSNGGLSAFAFAQAHPERVASLTGLPGMPADDAGMAALERLAGLPVALYVGGDDEGCRPRIQAAADGLLALGNTRVSLTIFDGEGHVPASLDGALLFDQLERQRAAARQTVGLRRQVVALLDDFHDAAAHADSARYFGHFAPGAVFYGTDASERWSAEQLAEYARPRFATGTGWVYVATERHVFVAPDERTAWFDERLHNERYGETRGSGVLVRLGDRWRISQYNLSIPVPNALALDLVERVRQLEREPR